MPLIPPVNFWTDLPTLCAVVLFIFGGFFPFDKKNFKKWKWLYYLIALLLIFFVWFNSAKQEQKNSIEQIRASERSENLAKKISEQDLIQHERDKQHIKEYEDLKNIILNKAKEENLDVNQSTKELAEEIFKKIAKRSIDPVTSNKIAEKLKSAGHQSIVINSILGDTESTKYAKNFFDIFKSAGWNVADQYLSSQSIDNPIEGVFVNIKSLEYEHDAANLLLNTLKEYGIPAKGGINPNLPPGSIQLYVGSKP